MALPRMLQLAHSTDNTTIVENNQIATAKDIAINGNLEDLASTRGTFDTLTKGAIDCNTLTDQGVYAVSSAGTVNGPGFSAKLIVYNGKNSKFTNQMALATGTSTSGAVRVAYRSKDSENIWSPWSEGILSERIGDGIHVTNGVISIPEMEGATSTQNGTSGLVPPPLKTDVGKTLSAEGNWIYPADIAISNNQSDLATSRGQIGPYARIGGFDFSTEIENVGNYFADQTGTTNSPFGGPFSVIVAGRVNGPTEKWRSYLLQRSGSRVIPQAAIKASFSSDGSTWETMGWSILLDEKHIGDGITVNNGIVSVPEYEGATTSTAGTSGLVPPAPAGKQNDFLTGGGEYKSALLTSGGKLTGSAAIVDTNNAVGTTPSANTEYGLYFEDKNAFVMGGVDFLQRQTHNNDKLVQIFSKNSSGKYQNISVATNEDGTGQATISCPTSIQGAVTNLSGTYTSSATERYRNSAIEIRENNYVQNTQTDIGYAPSIGFHWSNTTNGTLVLKSDGAFAFINGNGARATVNANVPYASESGTATKWNGAAKTVSTAAPSGGANGDIWFQY